MLGENIKTYRQKKGYTQEEVANRLHVTRQTISSKEQAESFLRTSIAKAIATGTIEEGQKFGYISTFEFNLSGNLETHMFENADVDWLHCIAAHRKKKCLSKLNVKWRGMILLQERLRMMQQTLPLLLTLPGLSGQQAIRRQTISASDSCCPIN